MKLIDIIKKNICLECTPIICLVLLGIVFGTLQYLAVAPMDKAEWFYGTKEERMKQNTEIHKRVQITYKNGVPVDTTEIIIKDIKIQ